ncbi:MAG: hypothetical protein H7Z14_04215 [Anaerolineae bacterium]|nr:hypothetical protein [Phycisphaerae bacterium]
MNRVLILGAGGAAGINLCRALRRAGGYFIIATDTSDDRLALISDLVDMPIKVSPANDIAHEYEVRGIISRDCPDVVYAQADAEVAHLMHRDYDCVAPMPSAEAWRLAADKLKLNQYLGDRGVPVPESHGAHGDAPAWFERCRESTGKVWVRARCGAGSKAALPMEGFDEAEFWMRYCGRRWGLKATDFMFCEFLPGADFAWQGLFFEGELICGIGRERLEYVFGGQMPSGQSSTPSIARIVHSDDLNTLAEWTVRLIDDVPNGVYGVDTKANAAGRICVTEVNVGRFYTTSDFYAAAGVNLPDMLMRLEWGPKFERPLKLNPIAAGTRWVRSLDREAVLVPAKSPTLRLAENIAASPVLAGQCAV